MIIKKLNTVFHKHSKILFGAFTLVIIVSFMGFLTPGQFGCSGNGGGNQTIGEVYGKKVSADDLREFSKTYSIFSHGDSDNVESLFYQYCFSVRADQLGIHVSDEEVAQYMNYRFSTGMKKFQQMMADPNFREMYVQLPPGFQEQILMNMEQQAFADSKYDPEMYKAFVADMKKRGISEDDIAEAVRLQVKMKKLKEFVTSQVVVTPAEAEALYRDFNTKLHFLTATVAADKLPAPKDEDLKAYYDKNKDNYRCVRVVKFASGEDANKAYDKAKEFCLKADMQKGAAALDGEAKKYGGEVSPVKWVARSGETSDGSRLSGDLSAKLFDAPEGTVLTTPVDGGKEKAVYVGCLVNASGRDVAAEAKPLLEKHWRGEQAQELAAKEAERLKKEDVAKREKAFRALAKKKFEIKEEVSGGLAPIREGDITTHENSIFLLKKREIPTGDIPEDAKESALRQCRAFKGNAAWMAFLDDLRSHCKFMVNKEEKR